MIAAHTQSATIHLLRHYPAHPPRADDPYYHLFNEAKKRIKAQGLWSCNVGDLRGTDDCKGELELHHSHIEFADENITDPKLLAKLLGLHLDDDEAYKQFIEEEGNLEVLCAQHHRLKYGIHIIPAADWDAVRTHIAGMPPVEVVTGSHATLSSLAGPNEKEST